MFALEFYLFGPPRVLSGGRAIDINLRKALALLVYLAATKQSHSRDDLAALFWPENDQRQARAGLRRLLYRLNQQFGSGLLESSGETVGFSRPASLSLDVERFEELVARALKPLTAGDALDPAAEQHLLAAAALYTDDFLAGFTLPDCPAFDDWQFFRREELRRSLAQALTTLVQSYQRDGKYESAIPFARRWLALDPLHEPAHRQLMQLYARAGQSSTALRQYHECERMLATELDAPPDDETQVLYEAIRTKRFPPPDTMPNQHVDQMIGRVAPQPASVSSGHPVVGSAGQRFIQSRSHNLPAQATPFIGREQELAEILARLENPLCRLLTLTGPGGVGKTRLALQVARLLVERPAPSLDLRDGIVFVDLTPVGAADGMVQAIADALQCLLNQSAPPLEQLLAYLCDRRLLLVVDNLEHLVEYAELLAQMLGAAPELKVLATSRELLNLAEEWFHPVVGMDFPLPGSQLRQPLQTYSAMRLFEQCAHRARVGFALEEEQEQVRRICQLVDGNPLALELAAAWLKVVTPQAIADEIERNIDILTAQQRNFPARHRSMRAVLEQTWHLLSSKERQVLMRLSICRGGFLHPAASEIAGASLLNLANLVEKSLVRTTASGRYQMHELIRQFAEEQLHTAPADETDARQRHAGYYLRFLQEREQALTSREGQQATAAVVEEWENIRLAWSWSVTHQDSALLAPAVAPLGYIFWIRGQVQEAQQLFTEAFTQFDRQELPADPARGTLLLQLNRHRGSFHYFLGNYAAAQAIFHECLALCQRLDDALMVATVRNTLGALAGFQGQLAPATTQLCAALDYYQSAANHTGLADVQQELARISVYAGDYDEAIRWAEASLADAQQIERHDYIGYALVTMGWAHFCQGNYEAARQYNQEGLEHFSAIGHELGVALALGGLGMAAWASTGVSEEVLTTVHQSLTICRQIGHRLQTSHRLAMLAMLANDRQEYAAARSYAQEGLALAQAVGNPNFAIQNRCCLAEAAYATRDAMTAREHLVVGLQSAATLELLPRVMMVLFHSAVLLAHLDPTEEQQQLVFRLWALVAHHPTTWAVFRQRAMRHLDQCTAQWDMSVVSAAKEHPLDWQEAVTHTLATLSSAAG